MDLQLIQGIRFLLLKKSHKIICEAKVKFEQLYHINKSLGIVCELKKLLYLLWDSRDAQSVEGFLHRGAL